MKKLNVLGATLVAGLFLSLSVQAQIITWGAAQNMVGDTDVSATGTALDAATFYGSTDVVNGVTFNPLVGGTDGTISIAAPNGTSGTGTFTTASPSSVNYSNLVSVVGFGYQGDGTVTISDLTAGDTYQVQAWTYFGFAGFGTTTYDGSTPVTLDPAVGQFATGTFTLPTGSTETFDYDFASPSSEYSMINALSVREIGAVPEPSQTLLMGVGLAGILFLIRYKRLA